MQELGFSIQISEIPLKITVWKNAFRLLTNATPNSVPAQLKSVHRHNDFELFFVKSGTLTLHTLNGNSRYTDSILIVPPGLYHYVTADKGCNGCYLYFSIGKHAEELSTQATALFDRLSAGETALPLSEDEHFYVTHIDCALSVRTDSEDLPHLFSLLFSELIFRILPTSVERSRQDTKYGGYVNTIDQYISLHYTEAVRLEDLARVLFLCPKQISRILKKEYGCSLSELVNRHRLSAACMLLRYTELEIGEIASEVGYEYETYFYAVFRKEYGITPGEYREQKQQTPIPDRS